MKCAHGATCGALDHFEGGEPIYMWVSVFDHNQIRHTRHQRPVRIVLDE